MKALTPNLRVSGSRKGSLQAAGQSRVGFVCAGGGNASDGAVPANQGLHCNKYGAVCNLLRQCEHCNLSSILTAHSTHLKAMLPAFSWKNMTVGRLRRSAGPQCAGHISQACRRTPSAVVSQTSS